jgi:hypothetical protein
MNKERVVFSQLMSIFSQYDFSSCVKRYSKGTTPRKFSFYDQFLAMSYAQLTFRESLRDIEVCLNALGKKAYHMGFRSRVARSTLSYANDTRDWKIWHDIAQKLITRARKLYAGEELDIQFKNTAYAIDSTTITLCLTLFPWARYNSTARAIKLHTQLDLRGNIPSFILISQAKVNDINFLDEIVIEPGAIYIMDRGYFDFARLYRFSIEAAFFVTRIKSNIYYRRVQIFCRSKNDPVRLDAAIRISGRKAKRNYPQRMRLIEYYDSEHNKLLTFITNNFTLSAQTIADCYRSRWRIELFFKWIKQNLRIKAFFGNSENAVKSQIWIAISVYVMVAILKKELGLELSLHTMFQVLSASACEKMPILSAFSNISEQISHNNTANQLDLFNIPIGQ